jgi:2',3'-cyclic-nucleotide 2'-phosphodiesterase (5'-nucleotidase family)
VGVTFLHTNDFHGALTETKARFLSELKASTEAFYFDTGDCIKTGNLGIPLKRERAWDLLALAGCDAGVPGNRESHVLPAVFKAKLEGHRHPLLCANLRAKDGSRPMPAHAMFERSGLRVGVFGVMVAMVTERMATQSASAYLWDPPLAAAREQVARLRTECDVLVALTHIGYKQDLLLAEACPELDFIFGGHSHTVLADPELVCGVWICQGGSHGRYVGRYEWKSGKLSGGLVPLP